MLLKLTWSIVGCVPQWMNAKDVTGLCHWVCVRELPPITPAVVIRDFESNFADTKHDDKNVCQENNCFLQILKGEIQENKHGYLEMPLSFKAHPHLPDNRKLALTQLKHLKKNLDTDPKFKIDYVGFMKGVFKDGNAEKMDIQPQLGKVWYISHQGLYYRRKPAKSRWSLTAL